MSLIIRDGTDPSKLLKVDVNGELHAVLSGSSSISLASGSQIEITDGSNVLFTSTNPGFVQFGTAQHVIVDSAPVVAVSQSGSWAVSLTTESIEIGKVDQGTPNTLGNSWPVKITDGANVLGTFSQPIRIDPTGTTTQPISGSISVSNFPATQSVSIASAVDVSDRSARLVGHVTIDNASIAVTGTFFQATQPVSGTITANIGTTNGLALDSSVNGLLLTQGSTTSGQSGPLVQAATTTNAPTYTTGKSNPLSLDASGLLRVSLKDTPANTNKFLVTADAITFAAPQHVINDASSAVIGHVITDSGSTTGVSGTVAVTQSTSPWVVSGTITANIGTSGSLALDATLTGGTQKTKLVDSAGTNAATVSAAGALKVDGSAVTQPVSGTVTANTVSQAANLIATVTGVSGTAVTATLPAVAGLFHYITLIEIVAYSAVARTGTGAPVLVNTTNLLALTLDFQTAGAVGTSERQVLNFSAPLKSAAVNSATTIVAPATTNVLWRINVYYYMAA